MEKSAGNKILFSANPDTNYVFHMLSVAKCGYDNAYGRKHRGRYDAAALEEIKKQESRLTVRGGAHSGSWYALLVCTPAQGNVPAGTYYAQLVTQIEAGRFAQEKPAREREALLSVCRVMARYYGAYVDNLWPQEKARLERFAEPLGKAFDENGFTQKAEAAVGVCLPPPFFTAELVASVEDGAEGIDISASQDVFGIERSAEMALDFIAHEFIIFLLKIALRQENAFCSPETWRFTEGLAEYYFQRVTGKDCFFTPCREEAQRYRRLESAAGADAVSLYRAALAGTDV